MNIFSPELIKIMHSALNRILLVTAVASLAMVVVSGCNRLPVVEFDNLPLVASPHGLLLRNEQRPSGVEQAVAKRHSSGQMSQTEKAQFDKLNCEARGAIGRGADRQCYYFEQCSLIATAEVVAETEHSHTHTPALASVPGGPK